MYSQASVLGPATIVVVISAALGLPLLFLASRCERHRSKDNESFSRFVLILITWVTNIAIVLVYFEQSQLDNEAFDQHWYTSVCSTLGLAVSQMFAPQFIKEIISYSFHTLRRHRDRGYQLSLYAETDPDKLTDENSDQVRTQLLTQDQLYKLYTGPQFDGGLVLAQVVTVIFICLFYSSTMPLLYPICLIYLVLMYWYTKFMLLKYC